MQASIVTKILQRIGQPDLVRLLSEDLAGSELNSLLLEVFKRKTSVLSAPDLLSQYNLNRFVKPADLPPVELKRMELDLLQVFQKFSFQPIELSPVSVLGSCSVVAPADQNKILSALRGTEVLADATNALALHISHCKKTKSEEYKEPAQKIKFGTFQRHIRTQSIQGKGFTPHFKIGCLVTSGLDTGNYEFEKESLADHINVMLATYKEYYKVDEIAFRFLCRSGYETPMELAKRIRDFVVQQHPEINIKIIEHSEKEINYYKGIQYKVDIRIKNKWYEIGDGGFVDWTQQFLQNKKERMLTTGIGFDFMYRILRGDL